MPAPTRWLIGLSAEGLPEAMFLHVFDGDEGDAEMDFVADRTRALRFASWRDALRFAREHRIDGAVISDHPVADLVGAAHHDFDRAAAVA